MKVLVTGGAGFIGSHTCDALLAKGHGVRILDNLQPRVHPLGKPSYLSAEAEFIRGDVANRNDLDRALQGVDVVYHLAAYQDYMPDFSTFFHVNAESTALIYELIVAHKYPVQKVIIASSQSVYGEGTYRCAEHGLQHPEPRPLDQLQRGDWEVHCPACGIVMQPVAIAETVVNPHTAYGISKYAMELTGFKLGRRYNVPTVAMRYSIVQGPRNSFYNAYSGICRIFTLRMLHGLSPVIYEDGEQLRDYVYIGDVVAANLLAMEKQEADFQAFNVAGMRPVSVREFAAILARNFEAPPPGEVPGEFRLGDTRHTFSSGEKLKALGWRQTIPVEQVVEKYVAWVRGQAGTEDYSRQSEQLMKGRGVLRAAVKGGSR